MIFLDTNVISEPIRPRPDPIALKWLARHESEARLSTVAIAEIAAGIGRINLQDRAKKLEGFLSHLCAQFATRLHDFDLESAKIYGTIMGNAHRNGRTASAPDGMIAAITLRHGAIIATRNVKDFEALGVKVVNPWE
jgi:predicted nucleic acid-binding protein